MIRILKGESVKTEVLQSDEYWNAPDISRELSAEIAEFKPLTEEEAKAGWRKMVARLEAGEDIPGVALTPRGTVAFIIV